MPVLGAIGNASEYSFRGVYDNYPTEINFGNLVDAEPGQTYVTTLKLVEDINYKVPISIVGDGEYYIGNLLFDKTFDNTKITFDQTPTTFDSNFPKLDYTNQPGYIRNKNNIGLRIFGIVPTVLSGSLNIVDRSLSSYSIPLSAPLELSLRDTNYSFNPNGSILVNEKLDPGSGISTEYYNKNYSTTVTIGKKSFIWTVKTKQIGSATNLSFNDLTDIQFSTNVISNTYEVQGITEAFNYVAEITSSDGLLSVNYGTFVKSSTVKNGDIIRLSVTSSALDSIKKTVDLKISHNGNIGTATTSWNVTTVDSIPSNLVFTDNLSADLKSTIYSDSIIISGLSTNISFNISVTSADGLLSVNNGTFVKSTTIKNGDKLQLSVNTSAIWLEQKKVTVKLSNTSTTWTIKNRTIQANSDPNASFLVYAIPFNSINTITDVSQEVRTKSSLSQGLKASTNIALSYPNSPSISTEQTKYYLNSYKLAKGTSSRTFEVNYLRINTDSTQVLGVDNFTIEFFIRLSSFNFSGENGVSIFYASYADSRNVNDYFFQFYLKGDNWPNTSQYRRGFWFGYPNPTTGTIQFLFETSSQVLTTNTWHHVALTRYGNNFNIWVDGVNVAGSSVALNLTSTGYNFALPNFQRLINDDVYIQDLRLYKGISKYATNFNPNTSVNSIMEKYTP